MKKEFFYILGALLGDGYIYKWKNYHYIGLNVVDKNFAEKFAKKLSIYREKKTRAFCYKKRNIWIVRINDFGLFHIFKTFRENTDNQLIIKSKFQEHSSKLQFIEGFFDAEGCVKIIKEIKRKTPKVCLDITNTNYDHLQMMKILLKSTLDIDVNFTTQKSRWENGKQVFHMRVYKKEFIRMFFDNIETIKLRSKKKPYVNKWLKLD